MTTLRIATIYGAMLLCASCNSMNANKQMKVPPATIESVMTFPLIDDTPGELNRGQVKIRKETGTKELGPYVILLDRHERNELVRRILNLKKKGEGRVVVDSDTFSFDLQPNKLERYVQRFYVQPGQIFFTMKGNTQADYYVDENKLYEHLRGVFTRHTAIKGGTGAEWPSKKAEGSIEEPSRPRARIRLGEV